MSFVYAEKFPLRLDDEKEIPALNSGFDVLSYETLMQSDTDEFARFLSEVDFS